MVYARAHQYLSLSGKHFGLERWSIGFRMNTVGGTLPPTQAEQQALCNAYKVALRPWWRAQTVIGASSNLDLIKFNAVGVDGKYVNGWTNFSEIAPGEVAPNGSAAAPQVALVGSLMSGSTRGLASKGRVYLPSPVPNADVSNGQMTVGQAQQAAATLKDLVDVINGVDAGRRVVVASNTRNGAERSVTVVGVGRVLDTMRSRRRSLPDVREVQPLQAGAGFQFP